MATAPNVEAKHDALAHAPFGPPCHSFRSRRQRATVKTADAARKPLRSVRSKTSPPDAGLSELVKHAFLRAEYRACRDLAAVGSRDGGVPRGVAALYEARCFRVEGDFDACATAATAAAAACDDPAARIEALAIRGLAYKFLEKPAASKKDLDAVRRSLARDRAATLGWPTYFLALEAWTDGDFTLAATYARENVEAGELVPTSLSLLGWTEMKVERYAEAGAYFWDALERHRATGTVDTRLQGTMLHAISVVALETADLALAAKLESRAAEMIWPAALAVDRFNFLTNASAIAMLEGRMDVAYFRSREAVVRAPNSAYEAIGETNLAAIERLAGDDHAALLQLRRAWELLRARRWGGIDDEQRVALTNFAFHAAAALPAEARKAMTLYASLAAKGNARNSLYRDRRIAASESMATGRVAEALGNVDRARRAYEKALDIWQELRCDFRAAIVALDLRRITRDVAHEAPVRRLLERAPHAWLGSRLSPDRGPLANVSPAERLVLAGLLEGKSAKAIAESLDRSVNTINNHTRRIFKAFGVNSRAAVLARSAKLGITPKSLDGTS